MQSSGDGWVGNVLVGFKSPHAHLIVGETVALRKQMISTYFVSVYRT